MFHNMVDGHYFVILAYRISVQRRKFLTSTRQRGVLKIATHGFMVFQMGDSRTTVD